MKKIILGLFVFGFFLLGINQTLASDTGLKSPSHFASNNAVDNPSYVYSSNNQYAVFNDRNDYVSYWGFSLPTIPTGSTINGIEISVEAKRSSPRLVDLSLSWNGGNNFSSIKNLGSTLTNSDSTVILGSPSDKWGRVSWSTGDFIDGANGNFRIKVEAEITNPGDTLSIDQIQVKIYYTIPDTTAPSVSLTNLTDNQLVNNSINLDATASDNVGITKVEFYHSSPIEAKIGEDTSSPYSILFDTTTVTDGNHSIWAIAYDGANNHTTSSLVNIVVDNTAPTLNLPSNISGIEATSPAGAVVNFSQATASDVNPINPTVTCDYNSGETFSFGTTNINCESTDTIGNKATGSFKVTVSDTTPPEITAPKNQTFEATGPNDSYVLTQATANDITDEDPVIDYSPKTFPLGETEVTWTATDDAGNTSTTTSTVTITDKTAPDLKLFGNNPFDLYINNDYEEPGFSAIDLVDGDLTDEIIIEGDDFDNTVLGAHTITYTISDKSDNTTTIDRIVNIVDRNKPIIYRLGVSPVIVEGGSTYEDVGATAIDRDGSDISDDIVVSGWDFNTMILGLFEIYYDVTGAELGDMTGTNIADQAKRKIEVVDTTGPKITVDPLNVSIFVGDSYDNMTGVACTDNIDEGCKVITESNLDTSKEGEYTVIYNATDSSGNKAEEITRTINVITPDRTNPIITSLQMTGSKIIEVTFDEELQNNTEGHYPQISDFNPYNDVNKSGNKDEGDTEYGIDGVSYNNKIVTINLTNPINSIDSPRLYINPQLTSLIDLSGNYYNDGNSDDKEISMLYHPITISIGENGSITPEGKEGTVMVADGTDQEFTITPNEGYKVLNVTIDEENNLGSVKSYTFKNVTNKHTISATFENISRKSTGSYINFGQVLGAQTVGQVLGEEKFIFTQNMKKGTKGGEVDELQKFLNDKGYSCGTVDGIFGNKTLNCVKEFQKVNPPLKVDGIVGPKTREFLNK